ncbi:MAG: zinc-dependent metalloprotease [Holophagaceae bacterium]|nr:zinc-dependent metalloprotease [Holophagaceae bacterium]
MKVQPEDAEWDTHDARHASLRWLTGTDIGFAIGPSQVDPRSGEILDADIGIGEVWARGSRTEARETLPPKAQEAFAFRHDHDLCAYAAEAHQEMGFALDLLESRGEIAPAPGGGLRGGGAEGRDHPRGGHTLGLRHNFRASTIHSLEQISNADIPGPTA